MVDQLPLPTWAVALGPGLDTGALRARVDHASIRQGWAVTVVLPWRWLRRRFTCDDSWCLGGLARLYTSEVVAGASTSRRHTLDVGHLPR